MDRDKLITEYFRHGLCYKDILRCMEILHGHVISLRTLKRITQSLGLYRRKFKSDIIDVAWFILEQCETYGQMHGYRWIHLKCLEKGLVVDQDTVRILQHVIDPTGLAIRKKRRLRRRVYSVPGPNAVWHIDGYDKLSRYGIRIHGCIDGFSRHIIWLKAAVSNKNPNVIAMYFLEGIRNHGVYPKRVRADMGTENIYVEGIQKFLRRNHLDEFAGDKSFLYGKSLNNQRIESFWGMLRRQGIQYWINFFQDLTESGFHDGGYLDQELSRFCFLHMIQKTLDDIGSIWNRHRIRPYRQRIARCGRPFMLYYTPSLVDTVNYGLPINENDIRTCEDEIEPMVISRCSDLIENLCNCIMEENNISLPQHPDDMRDLYMFLRLDILNSL